MSNSRASALPTGKIATSTLWQIGSQVVTAALSIITVKFVAIGLTRELAGTYNSAYGYLQFFGILADAGLYAVAVRELSRAADKRQTLGTLTLLRTILALSIFTIAILIAWTIPAWRENWLSLGITIAAAVPVLTLLAGIQRSVFQVHFRMRSVFVAETLNRVVTALLIGGTVMLGSMGQSDPWTMLWFLAVGGIGAFVTLTISSVLVRRIVRIKMTWDPRMMKRLLSLAIPFGLCYLCMALYRNMDMTLIALLRPDFEIQNAFYGFALRANEVAFLIPTFLLNSSLPHLTQTIEKKGNTAPLAGKTIVAILLLSLSAGLTAIFWARPLMQLLTSDAYMSTRTAAGADTALMLLGPSIILNGFVLFSFYGLLALGKSKRLTRSLFAAAVLSLLLNIFLIPMYGFVGAAWTLVLVHILLVGLLFMPTLTLLSVRLSSLPLLKCVSYAVLLVIFLFVLQPLLSSDLWTGVGILALAGFCALLVEILGLRRYLTL